MKTQKLPAMIQAELMVASKKPHYARREAIDRVLRFAKLYHPNCFVETFGNKPLQYEKSFAEKYINALKTFKGLYHENHFKKCDSLISTPFQEKPKE